jgi:hypothetical protein
MRSYLLFALLLTSRIALADGTVSFSASEVTVAQDAGAVVLKVNFDGTPTPKGTSDFKIKFTDGTADAGYNYGPYGTLFDQSPIEYDLDPSQTSMDISVPIRLMNWGGSTYFTATLSGINGSMVGAISTVKVTIAGWHPPLEVLVAINNIRIKIKKTLHLKNKAIRKKKLRNLYARLDILMRSIAPFSEI